MAINLFDPGFYAQANPDLANVGLTSPEQLTAHFFGAGLNEGRAFSPFADLNVYRAANPDLAGAGLTANSQLYGHLVASGVAEGRAFSAVYDANFYRAANPDVAAAGFNNEQLFDHFRVSGIREGRVASAAFNPSSYLALNPDLRAAGLDFAGGLIHYRLAGAAEGRPTGGSAPAQEAPASIFLSLSDGRVGQLDESGNFLGANINRILTDIAKDSSNQLWGISFSSLYRLNNDASQAEFVGNLGRGSDVNALDFDNNDRLIATDASGTIYQIDTLTGAALTVGSINDAKFDSSGDLVFDESRNVFYATSESNFFGGSDILYQFDLRGNSRRIGEIGFSNVFGLSIDGGILSGYTNDGRELEISRSSGSASVVDFIDVGFAEIYGAAS
jgi:hypothetical protein